MFGRKIDPVLVNGSVIAGAMVAAPKSSANDGLAVSKPANMAEATASRSDAYHDLKRQVFSALVEIIDVSKITLMDAGRARDQICSVVADILTKKKVVMPAFEQQALLVDICNDVLGYGPIEPLLARDDIADIMVNGSNKIFIEVGGKVQETDIRFRDNAQLLSVCQRIVSQVGRRVDESSPICDARLPDGSACQRDFVATCS